MSQFTSLCAHIFIYSIIHVAIPLLPESCDFLYDCENWTVDKSWTRIRSGQSENNSNVPKTDHTTGTGAGFYLYLPASPSQFASARLLSIPLKQPHTCLIFWYSMYESDEQSLKVFTQIIKNSTMVEIWNKTGNMQNLWNEARVEFSYDGEFQIIFDGRKASAGHMALDDISVNKVCPGTSTPSTSDNITSIGNTDLKKNPLSWGVYVGIATGLAVILLIAGIVTLIIVRDKRQRQESHKKETTIGRGYLNANKHDDIHEEEKADISNQSPDGKRTERNESHLNVHTTNNYPCAEMPDDKFDMVGNTGYENTKILPYNQTDIYDYGEADDVSNTRYEPLRQMDGNTYDQISGKDDYENNT